MNGKLSIAQRGNPLRSDISWQLVLAQGIVALGIGVYALIATESARRNILFLIGVFLFLNGLIYAVGGIRKGSTAGSLASYQLVRAGIGIATGSIVVIDRVVDFMPINPTRVVAGIGLTGMGIMTLIGLVIIRERSLLRLGTVMSALLLVVWGAVTLYQTTNEANITEWIGWIAIVVGIALMARAWYRWRDTLVPATA